jgi:enoyl-CoA hydratase/carnithine racemase
MARASENAFPKLPASLAAKRQGDIAILALARPQKRNALDDTTVLGL